jgi:hypothetical protein
VHGSSTKCTTAALFSDRLDGVATDLPALADRARRQAMDAIDRQSPRAQPEA